jgi:formate dehydrogenase (NADP+) beta subunit
MRVTNMTDTLFQVQVPDASEYWMQMVKCRHACPVHTDACGYVTAIAEGRYETAYRIARATNPFASICGRVCGAPCEANCRRGSLDAPVAIRALKRFVTDTYGPETATTPCIAKPATAPCCRPIRAITNASRWSARVFPG